jgi:two-component system phosphate regulon sensor histidine kinase PhoR
VPRGRLVWHLFPAYLAITAVSLLAVAWYAARSTRQFYLERVEADLKVRAQLLEPELRELVRTGDSQTMGVLCKALSNKTATRITVILPSGRVLCDSHDNPAAMDDHSNRPEVAKALAGEIGSATRRSTTLKKDMVYVAIPMKDGEKLSAVLRTSVPLVHAESLLASLYLQIALGGLAIVVLAAGISFLVYRRLTRPLEELRLGAERFARGELSAKVMVSDSREVGGVARAMNQMAEQLDDRIRTIVRQRNEQEAVLASMAEGVLAVGANERLLSVNHAAARMLGISADSACNRSIQEVVRNPELQEFVSRALSSDKLLEGSVVLREAQGDRLLQVHGSALRDAQGARIGAVVVLNDVTRLRRLENVRREFVANVSHELKTPITSIKGFVETLLDGALADRKEAERFLGVVARHADRLNSIIEDLLLLSQVEQDDERTGLETEELRVQDVLRAAVEACAAKAAEKNTSVETSCPEPLIITGNMRLLTQAVANLLDNAIKFSEPGGSVRIEAVRKNGDAVLSVHDHGCGIPPEHLPRLGERFYRVDKARSRQQGGTGLGLAIVKHIMEAHGGALSMESTLGQGSSFHLRLPLSAGKA